MSPARYIQGPPWEPLPGKAWAGCRSCGAAKGPRGTGPRDSPPGEPCSGADRPERRSLARGQHTALPGKNGSRQLHFLFFSFKAEMSRSSCPGAVRTGDTTFNGTIPTGCSCCCLCLGSSFPFTSHPTPLFADALSRKGRQMCGCVIHTYIYLYIGV